MRKINIVICSVILTLVIMCTLFVGCGEVFSSLMMNTQSKINIDKESGDMNGFFELDMVKANGTKRLTTLTLKGGSKLELELKSLDVKNGKVAIYVVDGDNQIKVVSTETALGGDANVGFYEIRSDKKLKIVMIAEDFDGSFRLEFRGVDGSK